MKQSDSTKMPDEVSAVSWINNEEIIGVSVGVRMIP